MKKSKKKVIIKVGENSYNERELAQIIRRKMITKSEKNKKKYTRKEKHKGTDGKSEPFSFYIILVSLLNNSSTPALIKIGLIFFINVCFPLN